MTALGISQSEINMWKRCPRHWLVEYYWGFLRADASPVGSREFGLRWHTALEAHYGHQLDLGFVLDMLYGMAIEQYPDREKELRDQHEMAKIMAAGYLDWVAEEGLDAGLKVIETEAEVRVPLPGWEGLVDLRAKLDQVVYDDQTGLYSFLDHKSAVNFEREEVIRMDPQMRIYSLIAWLATQGTVPQLGQPPEIVPGRVLVDGGIIRTARRVKRTKSAKPPFYLNTPFRHSPELLAATLLSTQQVVSEIMDARYQLDQAHRAGGLSEQIQHLQLTRTRPVPILHDCSNMCPLSSGLCQLMDDGTGWMGALSNSGAYVRGDPYDRYTRRGLDEIKAHLAGGTG
jgi:hypothetical protein